MYYRNEIRRSLPSYTVISLIVCAIMIIVTSLMYSGTKLTTAQSVVTWICLLYTGSTFWMWEDKDMNFISHLSATMVPIGAIMMTLAGKGTWLADLHLWAGALIIISTLVMGVWKTIRTIPRGLELSQALNLFLACFAILLYVPASLILIAK